MGIFSNDYEKEAEELWEEVEKNLRPKDGLQHILMISGMFENSKINLRNFYCSDIYNMKINRVVEEMQKCGYSIIDIKFSVESSLLVGILIIYQ